MKKVLVTGATGFIGNYIVRSLLSRGYQVVATSRSLENAQIKEWYNLVSYIPFDIRKFNDGINYFEFFQKPDVVIHLAWEGLPNYKSLFHFEENLPVHYSFLKNLIMNGANDVTVSGTCFEYGMQNGELNESLPSMPDNPYALAKDTLRKYLVELKKFYSFSLKWPRLFYMYGQGQNPKSLFSQLDKAILNQEAVFNMSGGEQTRDFLPVENVAENVVIIAIQDKIEGIINCASGVPITVRSLVENYIHKIKAPIKLNLGYYPYPDYEPMIFWGNIEKLNKIKSNE